MLDGPLAFVDVDTQRDFLEPDGALYISGSEAILDNLAALTDFARAHHVPTIATACAHASGDEELKVFPPHCMLGTPGQERIAATNRTDSVVLAPDATYSGALPLHLTIQKRRYDVFSHPDARRLVAEFNLSRPTFVVYGVATDYCVKAAVEGLLGLGCRVAIVVDAVRAIDVPVEADLLTGLVDQGAELTLTEVVCS